MAKMTLDELVSQLRAAWGASLRSVVLYGSAATGEHIPKRSDYNVLVIVDALDVTTLGAASAVARAWGEAGNPPPLTMTESEWRGSSDIFPMEYADILERHRVLHGAPPFDGISVAPGDLRLQLEHEAMGVLLKLRQGVLAAGGDAKRQIELMAASRSSVLVVFRALLRLHGKVPPADALGVVREAAAVAGLDGAPFDRVVRHVRGEQELTSAEAGEVLAGYLRGVQQLVAHLDRYASQA